MSSLRKTIVARVVWLVAGVGLAATSMSFTLVTLEIDKFLDAQLQQVAVNTTPSAQDATSPLLKTEEEDHLIVQARDRSGNVIHRSGPLIDIPWQHLPGFSNVSENGLDWRVYRSSNPRQEVQIAQRWSARHEIAVRAATGAAMPFLLAIPVAWFIIGWSINRTLEGLRQLSFDVAQRSVDAVEPLRPVGIPLEIAPLIAALDELIGRHRQAVETQRRFVADAAHELRTPLAALQIQTDNLLADEVSGTRRELVGELGSGVRRASRLTNQLLEMARTEAAGTAMRQNVDLVTLTTSVLAEFVPLADAKHIELTMRADDVLSVKGDPDALRRLLSILLENALRYSAPGSLVEVNLAAEDKTMKLEIVDSGPGISPEALPFIYDRFFRAAPREIEGTGLGLAIAKKTADRNGLRLSHRNRTGMSGIIATIEFSGDAVVTCGADGQAGH
jgi:two-component system OmpR family sensor kinase